MSGPFCYPLPIVARPAFRIFSSHLQTDDPLPPAIRRRVGFATGERSRVWEWGRDVCSTRRPTEILERFPFATHAFLVRQFSRISSRRTCILNSSVGGAVEVGPLGKRISERVNRLVVRWSEFSNESVWALWCLHGRRHPEGWTVGYSPSEVTSALVAHGTVPVRAGCHHSRMRANSGCLETSVGVTGADGKIRKCNPNALGLPRPPMAVSRRTEVPSHPFPECAWKLSGSRRTLH
jgi:hypothetical protein